MVRRVVFLIIILIVSCKILWAQSSAANYYWIQFTDKTGTAYSIDHPEEFLSQRAIDRREKQNIEIDETDLPVSEIYLDSLQRMGFEIIHSSKWLNGCTAKTAQLQLVDQLSDIDFISFYELTKPGILSKSVYNKFENTEVLSTIDTSYYRASFNQIDQLNGHVLHKQGFRGKGIQIAILDNGFLNVNKIAAFDSLWASGRILGSKDFVDLSGNVFQVGGHGTNVLSAMGSCLPEELIGTAPDASYYLFRTEDDGSEYLIEEDNWVTGAEYADSLGVDIINSSLGYAYFNDPSMNHTYADMDGNTTRVTRGANMAAAKGILVCNSAGNEGNKLWHYIIAPSDGTLVMAVGAVDSRGAPANFTSFGPSSEGDIKPNVSALGVNAALIGTSGSAVKSNGTSFSSPLLAGMAACLWQAYPKANSADIKETIEQSASLYDSPTPQLGYGIPDFGKAMFLLQKKQLPESFKNADWFVFPNPVANHLQIAWLHEGTFDECRVQAFSLQGILLFDRIFHESNRINLSNLANLPSGLFILKLTSEEKTTIFKIVKR